MRYMLRMSDYTLLRSMLPKVAELSCTANGGDTFGTFWALPQAVREKIMEYRDNLPYNMTTLERFEVYRDDTGANGLLLLAFGYDASHNVQIESVGRWIAGAFVPAPTPVGLPIEARAERQANARWTFAATSSEVRIALYLGWFLFGCGALGWEALYLFGRDAMLGMAHSNDELTSFLGFAWFVVTVVGSLVGVALGSIPLLTSWLAFRRRRKTIAHELAWYRDQEPAFE